MRILPIVLASAALALTACNEAHRGNDSNVNEPRNEAAAESNTDKFQEQTEKDAEFTYEVVLSYYGDIKLAELANQRSRTAQVKEIAQAMVTDHTAALNDLKRIAQAKAISIPVEEDDDLERKIENLAANSAEKFDREWLEEMIDRHEDDINKFEKRLEASGDDELKAYIDETLPMLKEHKESLEALKENLQENS